MRLLELREDIHFLQYPIQSSTFLLNLLVNLIDYMYSFCCHLHLLEVSIKIFKKSLSFQ